MKKLELEDDNKILSCALSTGSGKQTGPRAELRMRMFMYRPEGKSGLCFIDIPYAHSFISSYFFLASCDTDSSPFDGTVGESMTIVKTITAFPKPVVEWSLQKSRDGGKRAVLKEGESDGRFSASGKMRTVGKDR